MQIQYVAALNDPSGNPQRGWVVIMPNGDVRFIDEGYEGFPALKRHVPNVQSSDYGYKRISVAQYRSYKQLGPPES